MKPDIYQSISAEQKELKELTKVLDMLKIQLIQLKNQLHSICSNEAKKNVGKINIRPGK